MLKMINTAKEDSHHHPSSTICTYTVFRAHVRPSGGITSAQSSYLSSHSETVQKEFRELWVKLVRIAHGGLETPLARSHGICARLHGTACL